MQAITNASLIKLMVSNRVYGIQETFSPQSSITLSSQGDNEFSHSADQIEKLLAANNITQTQNSTLAPSMENSLSQKESTYDFQFNTLPPINKITIGSLGVDAPIVSVFFKDNEDVMVGDFNEELKNGVATYPGTANPGTPGHSLIFGHSSQEWRNGNNYKTIFSMINELQIGDTFTVTRNGKLLTYRVKAQTIVPPTQVIDVYNEYNNSNTNSLSLVTCRPRGTDRNRMVVTSELVDTTNNDDLLTYATP